MIISDLRQLNLPSNPGIYFFKDKEENILYIGRATSLKDRVKSYFANDLIQTRGPLLVDMVSKANSINYIETDSVLEAIILESNEIKKYLPYYNTKEKDNKSYNFVIITDEKFPRVLIERERTLNKLNEKELKFKIKYQFGPYPQGTLLRDALKIIRKIFPFRDSKAGIKYQESFYHSLGLSPNIQSLDAEKDYQKTIRNIVLFFGGKKTQLIKTLEREMNEYAKLQEFEKAKAVRNIIYSLNHIQDVSLIKSVKEELNNRFRIEAYDISHLSGKDNVGVMTVILDGEIRKSEYKKFKISKDVNNDIEALKEVLIRRFNHPEWKLPDLIVIDGGLGQLNTTKEILKNIEIISIVKDNNHKPDHFLGNKNIIKMHSKSILLANSEAHRFAIAYHKKLRTKNFLKGIAI